MKFKIIINQIALSKSKLDLVDATILDYLFFICNSTNNKIENQRIKGHTWVDFNKIMKDNPLLRIKSKGAITTRIKKLKLNGFIETLEKRKNGHKLLYFQLTKKTIDLNDTTNPIHNGSEPIYNNSEPIYNYEPIKTIKNNSIKIKDITNLNPTLDFISDYIKEINSPILPESFYNYYESIGWLINNEPIKSWKAVLRSWGKERDEEYEEYDEELYDENNLEFMLEEMYEKMHKENNYGIDAKFL